MSPLSRKTAATPETDRRDPCACPLCTPESDGPICQPCWDVLTIQRAWSDAEWAVGAAMQALRSIEDTDQVAEALEQLEDVRCGCADRVFGEPGPAEERR
jgi:hypothetical protein